MKCTESMASRFRLDLKHLFQFVMLLILQILVIIAHIIHYASFFDTAYNYFSFRIGHGSI